MKKLLVLLVIIISMVGCGKKQDEFTHYDLKGKDKSVYIYYSDNRGREEYVLADLTPASHEACLTGLFYKVDEDDYILLERLEFDKKESYKNETVYKFYDNKLYGVGNGESPMYFEIELNAKESKIEEKNFMWNSQKIAPTSIKFIKDNKITVWAYAAINEQATTGTYFECSLKNYECEIVED